MHEYIDAILAVSIARHVHRAGLDGRRFLLLTEIVDEDQLADGWPTSPNAVVDGVTEERPA